jgi:hypothetical protein
VDHEGGIQRRQGFETVLLLPQWTKDQAPGVSEKPLRVISIALFDTPHLFAEDMKLVGRGSGKTQAGDSIHRKAMDNPAFNP